MPQSEYSTRILKALGDQRLQMTSARQRRLMDRAYNRLLEKRRSLEKITDEEIVGIYEMITEEVSPIELEQMQQR